MNKEKVNTILSYMEELFPDAACELHHQNNFELLVAVMLSAQTTDASVNRLTSTLFQKYKEPEDFARVDIKELEHDIKTIGLYRNKAKNLKAMSIDLLERFDGMVPSDQDDLESLPGVGRKTANVVRSVAFDIPAFAVDTHVDRISKRLGFAKKSDSVLTVEKKLMKAVDKEKWNRAHHQFIFFGRYFCKAKNPNCKECKIKDLCKEKNIKRKR